ncbi:MAG: hypothetical protein R3C11_12665 [Planctomycetaceae bacterium]
MWAIVLNVFSHHLVGDDNIGIEPKTKLIEVADFKLLSGKEASDLLEVVANAQSATFDSINTWTGKVKLDVTRVISQANVPLDQDDVTETSKDESKDNPEPIAGLETDSKNKRITGRIFLKEQIECTFSVDKSLESNFGTYEYIPPVIFEHIDEKKRYTLPDWNEKTVSLQRPEGLYSTVKGRKAPEFIDHPLSTTPDKPFTEYVIRDAVSIGQLQPIGLELFDPRSIFCFAGGLRMDSCIRLAAKGISNPEIAPLKKVSQSSDSRYVYLEETMRTNGTDDVTVLRTICDSQLDFLPIESAQIFRGHIANHTTWTYKKNSDIYLPESYACIKRDYSSGDFSYHIVCTFIENEINKAIPKEQFELAALGVEDGDRLLDNVENKLSIFKNGKPEKVPEQVVEMKPILIDKATSKVDYSFILKVNAFMVAIVGIGYLIITHRKKRAQKTK